MSGDTVLILGASGMLGHALARFLSARRAQVWGSVRDTGAPALSALASTGAKLVDLPDARNLTRLERLVHRVLPSVVVNCIGIVKQLAEAKDPVLSLEVNALFPHRLARLCRARGARLVHVSTDCVFSGRRGLYTEDDHPDPEDLYGRTKLLGEVAGPGTVTLRTSIIGHEIGISHGLLEWFLAQRGSVRGFTRAIFSGLPTCELSRVIAEHVLAHPELTGLYHVSAEPISKYDLLQLVARTYGKQIEIRPDASVECDRSLRSDRFRAATGYVAPAWPELIERMREDHQGGPRPS